MYIPFSFYFALSHFVSDFTLSTLVLFTFSTLPFYFYKRKTTPKKGRDIIPDIFDPVPQPDPTLMNRAFWRQNTTLMNRTFWRQNTTLMNRAFWRQNTTLMNRVFWRQNTRIHFT